MVSGMGLCHWFQSLARKRGGCTAQRVCTLPFTASPKCCSLVGRGCLVIPLPSPLGCTVPIREFLPVLGCLTLRPLQQKTGLCSKLSCKKWTCLRTLQPHPVLFGKECQPGHIWYESCHWLQVLLALATAGFDTSFCEIGVAPKTSIPLMPDLSWLACTRKIAQKPFVGRMAWHSYKQERGCLLRHKHTLYPPFNLVVKRIPVLPPPLIARETLFLWQMPLWCWNRV